ncbi:MAG: nucleotidyltransferase family protein [Christensenellales bacterium]
MKFTAIICEFNPLTLGHIHLIKKAKELTGEPILCLMSGNFVQRGEPAILNKNLRAKHAILAGADIVIELPVCYSLSSAPDFAFGAINILNKLGSINHLIFGSECGDVEALKTEAERQLCENENELIKLNLKAGKSFASSAITNPMFSLPNNILAIEYLKQIILTKSKIIPITIYRENNYNNDSLTTKLPSASAIRKQVKDNNFNLINIAPEFIINDLRNHSITNYNNLLTIVNYSILSHSTNEIGMINGVKEGLEYRIKKCFNTNMSFYEKINNINTKRYQSSLINRILLSCALEITKEKINQIKHTKPYIKVLAISEEQKCLLSYLKTDKTTLLTKKEDYKNLTKLQNELIKLDQNANYLYSCLDNNYSPNIDFTNKIVIKTK